jgi:hypothetical protein
VITKALNAVAPTLCNNNLLSLSLSLPPSLPPRHRPNNVATPRMPGVQIRASILLEHKEDGTFKCPQAPSSREERPFAGSNNHVPAVKGKRTLPCINSRSFNIPDTSTHSCTKLLLFLSAILHFFCPVSSRCNRLCALVLRVPGYRFRVPWFYSRR